jgi:hypothetical protein
MLAVPRINALPNLDAATYKRSVLHADNCVWLEKNCYVDIWIEVIHAIGLEPRAILPFVLAIDFEGDQWTFFKPPHDELRDLYGIDVQELNVWRPLVEHAVDYLAAGKLISTEADAFWLPDTAGTDYRRQHTKTTIVLADIDVAGRRLGYFHNAGYHALVGEDFVRTFRLDAAPDPTFMPLFAEFVRIDRVVRRAQDQLADLSWQLLRRHLQRIPTANPIAKFRDRFAADVALLQERGLAHYHAWAFATTRQLGAAFELAAANLRWLSECGHDGLDPAISAFDDISRENKTFILKGARAVNSKRPIDIAGTFDGMILAWDQGMQALTKRLADHSS